MPVLKSETATADDLSAGAAKVSENDNTRIADTNKKKSASTTEKSSRKKVAKKKAASQKKAAGKKKATSKKKATTKKKVVAKAKKKAVARKKIATKSGSSPASKKETVAAADKKSIDDGNITANDSPAAEDCTSTVQPVADTADSNVETTEASISPDQPVVDVQSDTETTMEGSEVEQTQTTAAAEDADKRDAITESAEQQPEGSFVHILDEPEKPSGAAGAEQSLSGENDDAFLILFDTDEVEDEEATVDMSDDGECKISMPSDIRLSRLSSVKDCLLHSLEAKSVDVDVSKVKRTDTASFQLFWSYSTRMKDLNIPFQLSGASAEFTESANLLGLEL